MRRLKKNIFYGLCGGVVVTLATVKALAPEVAEPRQESEAVADSTVFEGVVQPDSVKKSEGLKP